MAKNGRLDLKIDGDSKKRLIAKATYLKMNLTNFIEKIADEQIIFMDDKLINILKSYGYNLNTLVVIEDDGDSGNINTFSNEARRKCIDTKFGEIKE